MPSTSTPARKLAAIMFTDMEGYTALMQEDEEKAILVRNRHRQVFKGTAEKLNNENPAEVLRRMIQGGAMAGESGTIVATSMSEQDVTNFLRWEYSSICSDGARLGPPEGMEPLHVSWGGMYEKKEFYPWNLPFAK